MTRLPYICKNTLLAFLEMKFCGNFFSYFWGIKLTSKWKMNAFIVLDANTFLVLEVNNLVLKTNMLKMPVQTSPTDTHTARYQRLPKRSYVRMIVTNEYSPLKMGSTMLSYSLSSLPHPQVIYVLPHWGTLSSSGT